MKNPSDHLCSTYMVEDDMYWAADHNILLTKGSAAKVWTFTRENTPGKTLPRVKVCNVPGSLSFSKKNNFVMTIDSEHPVITCGQSAYSGDDMQVISKWITTNYDQLVRYWNEEYTADPRPFFKALTPHG
jgi:hypothetical protein